MRVSQDIRYHMLIIESTQVLKSEEVCFSFIVFTHYAMAHFGIYLLNFLCRITVVDFLMGPDAFAETIQ